MTLKTNSCIKRLLDYCINKDDFLYNKGFRSIVFFSLCELSTLGSCRSPSGFLLRKSQRGFQQLPNEGQKRRCPFSAIIRPKKRLIEKGEKSTNPATAPSDNFPSETEKLRKGLREKYIGDK